MKPISHIIILTLALAGFITPARAQNVSITDPGLDAAIRAALQKPTGPLSAEDLLSLTDLDASSRNIRSITGLEGAQNLATLSLSGNQLTNFALPGALTNLTVLDLSFNSITECSLPGGMAALTSIFLEKNQLTNLALPSDLSQLVQIDVTENNLASLALPSGLTNLATLVLTGNQLTTLTLPPDLTKLTSLFLDGNPLATVVLSEPSAARNLAGTVASLQDQGISVFTYPLTNTLTAPGQTPGGAFEFRLIGPPGVYDILASTDLSSWSSVGAVTNTIGNTGFIDRGAGLVPRRFYTARAR